MFFIQIFVQKNKPANIKTIYIHIGTGTYFFEQKSGTDSLPLGYLACKTKIYNIPSSENNSKEGMLA